MPLFIELKYYLDRHGHLQVQETKNSNVVSDLDLSVATSTTLPTCVYRSGPCSHIGIRHTHDYDMTDYYTGSGLL